MSSFPPEQKPVGKSRIFITGSADGLGLAAAKALLDEGHDVVVHVRSHARLSAVAPMLAQGAVAVVGDLANLDEVRDIARQVNAIGPMDAIIHNAGVLSGDAVLVVNVVAPYLLTALLPKPKRLVYLSSSMHRSGTADLATMDWSGQMSTGSYSDSKLFVTALTVAVARLWPGVSVNAVDPGWVPTKMGGASAPDDLRLGHVTQAWLATTDEPRALTSGGYWHHQEREEPHPAVYEIPFQNELVTTLARATGTVLPE